jgi:hypothetical protein
MVDTVSPSDYHTMGNKTLSWNEPINHSNVTRETTEAEIEEGAHSMQEEKSHTLMDESSFVGPNGESMPAMFMPDSQPGLGESVTQTGQEVKPFLVMGKVEETEE